MNSNFKPILGCFTIIGVIFTILGVIVAIVALFKPAAITVVLQGILPEPTPVIVVVPSPTPVRQLGPTNTPGPSPTPTHIPIPAETPILTSAPAPTLTPTPIPDTPEGTILEIGETWRTGGVLLTLKNATLGAGAFGPTLSLKFLVINETPHLITFSYHQENDISVVDNLGHVYTVFYGPAKHVGGDAILQRGDSCEIGETWGGPFTDPGVTEIIVTASFSRIKNAKWRIPVYH